MFVKLEQDQGIFLMPSQIDSFELDNLTANTKLLIKNFNPILRE